ncbi:MAG TPA: precorrin-2 C(20)-methyltransferase [Tissierellaceae bacterium]
MKLYGIGTGPGATDLLTLRAVNSIKDSSIIFAPNNRGKNMAVDTCKEFIEEKKVNLIDFPMGEVTREDYKNAAKTIYEDLKKYKVGSFLTIGDSMIYSTFIYIAQELMEIDNTVEIEIVPGIPSFVASAARAQVQLTEKSENFLLCDEFDEKALEIADSIAILKTFKNKEEILEGLERNNFSYNYIKKVSLPDEEILDETRKDEILNDKNYMSLILGRRK